MQEEHTEDDGDEDRNRTDQEFGNPAPDEIGRDVNRCNIHIFEGFIMLTVINHCPGYPGHHRTHIDIKCISQVDVGEDG